MSVWIVPGAPLPNGAGWRLWYSFPGVADPAHQPPIVRRAGQVEAVTTNWQLLPHVAGVNRRMGICTVTLQNPAPGETYDIESPGPNAPPPLRLLSQPDVIPAEGMTFLLASCFWRDNDREGAYAAAIQELVKLWKPAYKLLVGDQLYADWPWDRMLLRNSATPEVDRYAERYEEYWGDPAYQTVLRATPNLITCDDHEFWNNFPQLQVHIGRTLTVHDRIANASAARNLYALYQSCLNPGGRRWFDLAVGSVSTFVADTRSQRDQFRDEYHPNPPHFMPTAQWNDLTAWIDGLKGPGILVLGQPLFLDRGDWKDYGLADYRRDYERLWELIRKSLRGQNAGGTPHDILVLSGDIHTGRYSFGAPFGINAPNGLPELIASPASMVQPGSSGLSLPPTAIRIGPERSPSLAAYVFCDQSRATLDDNVAVIRMSPGDQERLRFELMIYSIRPYDSRSWWDRRLGVEAPKGWLRQRFRKEIELR